MSDEDDITATSATDDDNRTIRSGFDWTTISPSTAVIETVAIAANTEPEALESLYDWVDTDAIDSLFKRHSGDPSGSPLSISFAYDGYAITVEKKGTVAVEPSPE